MEAKEKYFIYDGKEMGILIALGVMVAVFSFTLGIHLGKKVGTRGTYDEVGETFPVKAANDQVLGRQELSEQLKEADQMVEQSLETELHNEVARTGLKLDTPRQVDLPAEPKSKNAGATTSVKGEIDQVAEAETPSKGLAFQEKGNYTIQVGSFPSLAEAKGRAEAFEELKLSPFVRAIQVEGKGRWFRIYLNRFPTQEDAQKAATSLQEKHVIKSFLVVKLPD